MTNKSIPKEERIILAAEQVFSHKGYRQATLDEIIKIADTGKGTVYKYYKNKENLFYTLVNNKNKPFAEKLQQIVLGELDFEDKLKQYCRELIKFMQRNYIIWQVLLFEMTVNDAGWKLKFDAETGTFQVQLKWGQLPTEAEIASAQRYYEIIHTEISALELILTEGMDKGILKPTKEVQLWASNIFFGIIMSLFQWLDEVDNSITAEEAITRNVNLITDRFLNGNKI